MLVTSHRVSGISREGHSHKHGSPAQADLLPTLPWHFLGASHSTNARLKPFIECKSLNKCLELADIPAYYTRSPRVRQPYGRFLGASHSTNAHLNPFLECKSLKKCPAFADIADHVPYPLLYSRLKPHRVQKMEKSSILQRYRGMASF